MNRTRVTIGLCSILSILALSQAATAHPSSQTGAPRASVAGPSGRYSMGMADDAATGQVVLFGGEDSNYNYLGDTWTWDGSAWTQQYPVDSPVPRKAMGMAYDPATGQVVLFGGIDAYTQYGDTWVWDGANWNLQSPALSPPTTCCVGMAFDSRTQMLVMVSWNSGNTWSWDGANWNEGQPNLLYRGSPATATLAPRIVSFGGSCCIEPTLYFHDTWVYNGSTWTKRDLVTHPGNRAAAGMAFDPTRRQDVLFGGVNNRGTFGDTWTFDGRSWTRLSPPTSPVPRYFFGMILDSTSGQILLFGGLSDIGYLGDTWTWDGSTWTCLAGCP